MSFGSLSGGIRFHLSEQPASPVGVVFSIVWGSEGIEIMETIERARALATEPRDNDVYPYRRIAESPLPHVTAIECIKQSYRWNDGDWMQWIECAVLAERERCAKIADEMGPRDGYHFDMAQRIADKIREAK